MATKKKPSVYPSQTEGARRARGRVRRQFSLPADVDEALEDYSEQCGVGLSETVEHALRKLLGLVTLALFVALGQGCAAPLAPAPAPHPVVLGCGPELVESCERAARVWRDAGAPVVVNGAGPATHEIVFVDGSPEPCTGTKAWNGCTRDGVIELNARVFVGVADPVQMQADVLAHEIGHALGVHVHLAAGIMSADAGWAARRCVDAEASAALGVLETCGEREST